MTEQQIKRAKRLAEILELEVIASIGSMCYKKGGGAITINGVQCEELNPEQDKALLWDLQHKYKTEITYDDGRVVVYHDNDDLMYVERAETDFSSIEQLPAALIDCVIEINGGYDD